MTPCLRGENLGAEKVGSLAIITSSSSLNSVAQRWVPAGLSSWTPRASGQAEAACLSLPTAVSHKAGLPGRVV